MKQPLPGYFPMTQRIDLPSGIDPAGRVDDLAQKISI